LSAEARLILSIVSVVVVLMGATAGYMLIEGESLSDSLYMTVITVFTVGYKEAFDVTDAGRFWTMVVILVGYATVAISVANLVSLLVGGELRAVRGRLRMKSAIEKLNDHVIICGYGRMGAIVADDLRKEGRSFVAVDSTVQFDRDDIDVLSIQGDATEDATLLEAGIMRAEALVACLASDADNVYVTLSARELRNDLTIIARAEQLSTEKKMRRAGADVVICPHMIGANKVATLLLRPHVMDFVDMAAKGVDMAIAQYEVTPNSPFVGKRLRDSDIRSRANVTVVAIKRADGTQIFSPGPDEPINESDQLILLGRGGLSERLRSL